MSFSGSKGLRGMVGVLAVAVYVLPAVVIALSAVGHGASHVVDEAREQYRIASALGLTHSSTPAVDQGPRTFYEPGGADSVVHSHGGAEHAHFGVLGGLLVASDDAHDQVNAASATSSTLSAHIPPTPIEVRPLDRQAVAAAPARTAETRSWILSPPLRPPRA